MSSEPVGLALAMGSLTVAANLRLSETAGDSRDRMARAVESMTENLRHDSSEVLVGDLITSIATIVEGTIELDRRALLIELTVANPFAPYWFSMTDERERYRLRALKLLAALSLHLEPDSVDAINRAWRKTSKRLASPFAPRLVVAAGPLIALAMPAAANLGGPAAVSAGLAQLGFGSVGQGGLGLMAGRWLLGSVGTAPAPVGPLATTAAVQDALAVAGSAHLLEAEISKLVLSARLATRNGWFGDITADAGPGLDRIAAAIATELDVAEARNDRLAFRIAELRHLLKTADRARSAIARLAERPALEQRRA